MEFEDKIPTSDPSEADAASSCNYNHEQTTAIQDVNVETNSSNIDNDSDAFSDSDLELDLINYDTHDSGNEADVSATSDSDTDIDVVAYTDSEDCNTVINTSDDPVDVFDDQYISARGYQLKTFSTEDDFSDDSSDSDLSVEMEGPLSNDDPFCGFVDRSVVVECVKTVNFYEVMDSINGHDRDPDSDTSIDVRSAFKGHTS